MTSVHQLLKRVEKVVIDNSPGILTGVGVAGTVLTAYLTGSASIKAHERIRQADDDREDEVPEGMELVRERLGLVWDLYIPPVGVGIITVSAIVGANRIGTRRAAALAAAYSISERAFTEYREKVVERIGEGKERAIRDEVAQEQVSRTPVKDVIIAGSGDVLCYEALTGRYFMSNMERLRKAENEINYQLLHECYASLSDFFDKIGLSRTDLSEEVGWKNTSLLELRFSATLSDDDRPCIAINYRVEPVRDYYRF